MNHPFRPGTLVLVLGTCAALAGAAAQAGPPGDPADAGAPVPPTRYTPVLPAPPAAQGVSTPPENWKALNEVVAGNAMSMPMAMDMAEPKKQETAPPDPHAGHHHKETK